MEQKKMDEIRLENAIYRAMFKMLSESDIEGTPEGVHYLLGIIDAAAYIGEEIAHGTEDWSDENG